MTHLGLRGVVRGLALSEFRAVNLLICLVDRAAAAAAFLRLVTNPPATAALHDTAVGIPPCPEVTCHGRQRKLHIEIDMLAALVLLGVVGACAGLGFLSQVRDAGAGAVGCSYLWDLLHYVALSYHNNK